MFLFVLALIVTVAGKLEAMEIKCEKIASYDRFEQCCFFNGNSTIGEKNVAIDDMENGDVGRASL